MAFPRVDDYIGLMASKYYSINVKRGEETVYLAPGVTQILDADQFKSFRDRLSSESDRGLVLVSAALIDDLMTDRLKTVLHNGDKRTLTGLFEGFGPFSSFSAKIDTLYCMGDLAKSAHRHAHMVRKVRNHCAHNWADFTFNEEIDKRFFAALDLPAEIVSPPPELAHLTLHPRSKFNIACFMLIETLNFRLPTTDNAGWHPPEQPSPESP